MPWKSMESLLCSLFGAGVAILIVTALPIAQITFGAVNINECPAAPVVPVYVMVGGILALLLMGLLALPKLLCPAAMAHKIWNLLILSIVLLVFIWFIFGSYHIYSVYPPNYIKSTIDAKVFNNSAPSIDDDKPRIIFDTQDNNNQTQRNQTLALGNDSNETNVKHLSPPTVRHVMAAPPYCNKTIYLFAFWTTTLVYALAANALVLAACICAVMKAFTTLTKYVNV